MNKSKNETSNNIYNFLVNQIKACVHIFFQQQQIQQNQHLIKQSMSPSSKSRVVPEGHSVLNTTGQKITYVGNLHENVKELHIDELFGFKKTIYL